MISLYLKKIKKIFKFLSTRLTLDPACGSGAFPIGMLNTLMKVVKRLNIKSTNSYEVKKNLRNVFLV